MRRLPILSFLFVLPLAAQQSPAQDPEVEQAWQSAARGDRQLAEQQLYGLLKRRRDNAEARLLLGSLLTEEGKRDEALAQLQEAVRLLPRSATALNALGEAYNRFNDPAAALHWFQLATQADFKLGIAQSNLGAALLNAGDATAAKPHLIQAARLLANSADAADAHYLLAKIDAANNNISSAIAHLQKSVALRPNFAEAWSDLGQFYKLAGNDERALAAFQRAVELDSNDAVSQYRLGAQYLHLEKPRQAESNLQLALRLNPEDQSTLNALVTCLRQLGRPDDAARIKAKLSEVIRKRDRGSQNALQSIRLNNEATVLEEAGDLKGALDKYRQAHGLNPEHSGIQTNFAVALLRTGNWAEGLTELHQALEHDPANPKLQAAWRDALAQAPPEMVPAWAKSASAQPE